MGRFHHKMVILMFLAFITISYGYDDIFGDDVARGDEFIDKLLKDMLEDHGHEYDPYLLEDSVIGFSKKITFVNVSGEAKLHNGYITGLKTLHRPDHCSVKEENGKLLVSADLGIGVVDARYDGTVKFMNFGPTITVYCQLAYAEIHMEFSVDSKTGRDGSLNKFQIDDMKGMKVWITGLGPLNWSANYMISAVTTIFKGFIRNMLEKKIRDHIADRLPDYKFPVDGDDTIETTVSEITEIPELTENPEELEALEKVVRNLKSLERMQFR